MANDNENSRGKAQEAIAGRGKAQTAQSSGANIANFSDWLFFGNAPSVFLSVSVTPAAQNIALTYVLVVLETPGGLIVSDAALSTGSAQAGWAVNIATDCGIYDKQQYGTQLQGWAYAQAYVGGQLQSQYSAIQSYTVS